MSQSAPNQAPKVREPWWKTINLGGPEETAKTVADWVRLLNLTRSLIRDNRIDAKLKLLPAASIVALTLPQIKAVTFPVFLLVCGVFVEFCPQSIVAEHKRKLGIS